MIKPSSSELTINVLELKKAALLYRAINHRLRQQILHLIHRKEEIDVSSLYRSLKIEQSVASQHLAILRRAGIVTTRRDGKWIYYTINHERIAQLHAVSNDLVK